MEDGTHLRFECTDDGYVAPNVLDLTNTFETWPPFPDVIRICSPQPSPTDHFSVDQHGQITPPSGKVSPATVSSKQCHHKSSVPLEQLHDKISWPVGQKIQQFGYYQLEQHPLQPESASDSQKDAFAPTLKQTLGSPLSQQEISAANPQQSKRKRGRPKSQRLQSSREKNRVAAHKCRQRKKEYMTGFEERARQLSTKNKQLKDNVAILREEVLKLKNKVLQHTDCGFQAVDKYVARCIGDILGVERISFPLSKGSVQIPTPKPSATPPSSPPRLLNKPSL